MIMALISVSVWLSEIKSHVEEENSDNLGEEDSVPLFEQGRCISPSLFF